jgi:hypothetical protein
MNLLVAGDREKLRESVTRAHAGGGWGTALQHSVTSNRSAGYSAIHVTHDEGKMERETYIIWTKG